MNAFNVGLPALTAPVGNLFRMLIILVVHKFWITRVLVDFFASFKLWPLVMSLSDNLEKKKVLVVQGSWNLKSDALPIEPPRHPISKRCTQGGGGQELGVGGGGRGRYKNKPAQELSSRRDRKTVPHPTLLVIPGVLGFEFGPSITTEPRTLSHV